MKTTTHCEIMEKVSSFWEHITFLGLPIPIRRLFYILKFLILTDLFLPLLGTFLGHFLTLVLGLVLSY